jgi:asparagine synthase (glutamine-hydrolysing)
MAALVRWGVDDALKRFIGMFAFVLLDADDGSVVAARDPFGIKPLYHARFGNGIAFSSEPGVLSALPGVDRQVDPNRLWEYLAFGVTDHGDKTLVVGIGQVPPAHIAVLTSSDPSIRLRRYWNPPEQVLDSGSDLGCMADRLRELFLDSVRLHLRSDVPVGVALSGGIDSSAIACAIRHLDPEAEIHAFTFDAGDAGTSEVHWAALAVEHIGATWHKVGLDPSRIAFELRSLVAAQGEPFGSTSILAQHAVFQAAREAGVTVMLDGQGADELFAGYPYYQAFRVASLLSSGDICGMTSLIWSQGDWPGRSRIAISGRAFGMLLPTGLVGIGDRLLCRGVQDWWADKTWFSDHGVLASSPYHRHFGRQALAGELRESIAVTNLPALLRYEDRNSMRHSVESRVPFLITTLAGFALRLPEDCLIATDGTSKALLRCALRGLVPDALLDRRDKVGFATPERAWLSACPVLIEEALAEPLPGVDRDAVRKRIQDPRGIPGRGFLTWRLINYGLWSSMRRADVSVLDLGRS